MSTSTAAKGLRERIAKGVCKLAGCEDDAASRDTVATSPRLPIQDASPPAAAKVAGGAVVATDLTKVYSSGVVGAEGIDLHASPGEIVAVVGPNGAGKSTTLNMLTGLLRPSRGTARIHDVPASDVKRVGRLLGVALQTSGLDVAMTGWEHFEVQAALYYVPHGVVADRATHLLELFGLEHFAHRQVGLYSAGLQRRLALALALIHDPAVLILDEPTTGLDPQSKRMMWSLLERMRTEGRTIIFSTQVLEEADFLAQRIYVIADGRVVAQGSPAELRAALGESTIRVRAAKSRSDVSQLVTASLPHLGQARIDGEALVFSGSHGNGDARRMLETLESAGVELLEFSVGRPSLEDAFVRLTGSKLRTEPLVRTSARGKGVCRRCK